MRYLNHLIIFSLLVSIVALSGCSAGRRAFSKGEQLEAEGNYEDAMYSYAEAFRNEPDAGEFRARFFKARDTAANLRYKKGLDQFDRADYVAALAEFQTAYGLDPTQERYKQKMNETTRLKDAQLAYREGLEFEKANKLKDANRTYLIALELHPDNIEYQAALTRISGQRKSKLEGFELSLKSSKPITLKFKDAKIKDVFKIITQLTGINFIFDDTVKDQPVSIYLENATFQQAMDLLTNMNKLHSKVLNESTVILFPATPEKSKQYNDLTVRTFHLSYMDAKKAVNLVRTMLQVKKIHVNEESNSLVVRDTEQIIGVIEKIIEANDVPDPEVVLDVEVMEITDRNAQNLGLLLSSYNVQLGAFNDSTNPPTPLSGSLSTVITTPASGTGGTTTQTLGVANLVKAFSMGGYSGFVTVPNAQYNFGKTLTKGEVLSNPKIRVRNKEKAKFNVGQRVPITTTTLNGTLSQVNVQYVDVGVKLNAEPNIQLNNEIIIKLSLEVSSILSKEIVGGSSSPTSVVTIGTRNLDTVLSLKDGETSIIGGLIQNTQNSTKQKIYLLSDIPLIGPLLTNHDDTKDKTELILAITPRLVRSVTVPQNSLMSFDSGKEDDPSLRRPMASFDQEPVFEGEAPGKPPAKPAAQGTKPAVQGTKPAVQGTKPAAPGVKPSPPPAGAAPTTAAPSADAGKPAGEGSKPSPAVAPAGSVPPGTVPGAAVATTPAVTTVPALLPAAVPVPTKRGLVQIAAPAGIDVGQQFYADIKAGDVQNLAGASFVLSYDPKFVDYVSANEGPFLKKDGKPTVYSATANAAEGTLTVKLSRAPNSGGMSGAGTLVSALFRAKAKGAASFGFQSVSFTSADGKPHEMLPFSTAVTIR
ncbi:MAG: type II secretion system protein [Geobacteraceae bacterium]|nr:type II secretion system protein [Geobacteraceae bacterium]